MLKTHQRSEDIDAAIACRAERVQSILTEAATLAGDLFHRREELVTERKGPMDFVSMADRAVEERLRDLLARAFPSDGFVGEELDGRELAPEFSWVVDPIDGTTNFLIGIPYWCISAALIRNGEVVAGWIEAPMLRQRFAVIRGHGAHSAGRALRCRSHPSLREAVVSIGKIPGTSRQEHRDLMHRLTMEGADFRRLGAAALCMAHVAAGRLDAFYEAELSLWDYAAGVLMVEEAGGMALAPRTLETGISERVPAAVFTATMAGAFAPLLKQSGVPLPRAEA